MPHSWGKADNKLRVILGASGNEMTKFETAVTSQVVLGD